MKRVLGNTRVAYLQVENRFSRRGIICTESRQGVGTALARDYAEEHSEDSHRSITSCIERLNLRKRMYCSLLSGHSSQKLTKLKCIPPMQARVLSRPLTVREVFSWVAPPPEERFRQTQRILARLT